jgi:hypothetical protein
MATAPRSRHISSRAAASSARAAPPGFSVGEAGQLELDFRRVQPNNQQFAATGFRAMREISEVLFLFGANSRFADSPPYFSRAIEITMDAKNVWAHLVDGVWTRESSSSTKPMIYAVENGLTPDQRAEADTYNCELRPPPFETWQYSYRAYQADYTSAYVWGAHGALEFINLPSSLITTWRKLGQLRDGDSARSLLTVVMPRSLLYAFFVLTKKLFVEGEFASDDT